MKPFRPELSTACTLVSASCTTGWFDWIHGELWLCPDGLLRRSMGLEATIWPVLKRSVGHDNQQTIDPQHRPTETVAGDVIARIVASDRRNHWITWPEISRATLKRGIIDHSLHLELGDGRRVKFLWLRAEGGYDLLQESLSQFLPGRFTAQDRPIG